MGGARIFGHHLRNFKGIHIAVTGCMATTLLFAPALYATVINIPSTKATIQAGINAAVDGDTVLVAPGTYVENLSFLGKDISIISDSGALNTIIRPANPAIETIIMDADTARLTGFSIIDGAGSWTIQMYNGFDDYVSDNIFYDFSGIGSVIKCRCNAMITRNLFYNNRGTSCIEVDGNDSTMIVNNTFYNNNSGFFSSEGFGIAYNNIVMNSVKYGIQGDFESLDYNCLWNNIINYENCPDSGANSIIADPEFNNADSLNFGLTQSSPCIDAGNPDIRFNDLDGSRSDIGAISFLRNCPRVYHINLGDEQREHISDHTPTFYWSYHDTTGVQEAFEIEIGNDSDWNVPEMWSSGEVLSNDTSVLYMGAPLLDGETYYVRIRSNNSVNWGDWTESYFRMNSVPLTPVMLRPINHESVESFIVNCFVHSTDGELDEIFYEYELYDNQEMDHTVCYHKDIPGTDDSTTLGPILDLESGHEYWWRARAYDGFEYSEWSMLQSFVPIGGTILNVPNEYATIQSAIDMAVDGDMVLVAPGTYQENIICSDKNIRIVGSGGALSTFLNPNDPSWPLAIFSFVEDANLDGFTLSGGEGDYLVYIAGGSRAVLTDCIFRGFRGNSPSAVVVKVRSDAIIKRNLFYDNAGNACIGLSLGDDIKIINNTFDRNTQGLYSNLCNGVVRNNIFTHSVMYAINGKFTECDYNCFWQNAADIWSEEYPYAEPGLNNIVADPRYMYRLSGDFRLLPESPCIDAGDPGRNYYDADGSRNDIGASPFDISYPIAVNFNYGPNANGDIVDNPYPEFYWSFADTGDASQYQYELELNTRNDWRFGDFWSTGPVQSADTHVVYQGEPLNDHSYYVVRIRLHNGSEWGSWLTHSFSTNIITTPSDWTTHQGNVLRTGHNPHDRIRPPLERKWSVRIAESPITPVTIVGDKVFLSKWGSGQYVWCLDANDGHQLWRADYPLYDHISQPSYGYGMVFVQLAWAPGYVSAIDINTGDEVWRQWYPSQGFFSLAPAVYEGKVMICGDMFGGIHTFDANTGEVLWRKRLSEFLEVIPDGWSPAVYADKVYAFYANDMGGVLHVMDAETGRGLWGYDPDPDKSGVDEAHSLYYDRLRTMPVIDTTLNMVYCADGWRLYALDIITHELVWQTDIGIWYYNTPAIYNGRVYVIHEGFLEVLDGLTGDSLWSFTCEEGFLGAVWGDYGTEYSPVIANDYLFLASYSTVYAIDMRNRELVWSCPVTGFLSVAHEQLYVSSPDGFLHVFGTAPTDIENEDETAPILPNDYVLSQNYPNPFNASTRIDYSLPRSGNVTITIYNILGETVRQLVNEYKPAGEYMVIWNGKDDHNVTLASGIYIYRLTVNNHAEAKTMLLLK